MQQITITAPGKLMLSGEWSVLENGIPCVVMAIDQRVLVTIKESKEFYFAAKGTTHSAQAQYADGKVIIDNSQEQEYFLFVSKAVEATLRYLHDGGISTTPVAIETNSSETTIDVGGGKKAKVGFGSSAAIVAATVAAVLAIHGQEISSLKAKEVIFKLGCIAHYLAQGKIGSSFDVAASTYGGMLLYQKPDMQYVTSELAKGTSMKQLVAVAWPLFRAEPLAVPKKFNLSIGFVGYSASTKDLIAKLDAYKKEQRSAYDALIQKIKEVTEKLIIALKKEDTENILSSIKQNRALLKELHEVSKNNLETKELALLADLAEKNGGAGKFSGAGGGDCGIAISFDAAIKKKIEVAWKKSGIHLITAPIAMNGAIQL